MCLFLDNDVFFYFKFIGKFFQRTDRESAFIPAPCGFFYALHPQKNNSVREQETFGVCLSVGLAHYKGGQGYRGIHHVFWQWIHLGPYKGIPLFRYTFPHERNEPAPQVH